MTYLPTYRKHSARSGFTLIEAVMSILIVGLMLVAALHTIGASRASQAANAQKVLGPMLARDLMTEVLNNAYAEATDSLGPDTGEDPALRSTFDDVDDYHGWLASPPQLGDGTPIDGTNGWTRTVQVTWIQKDSYNAMPTDTGLKQIQVTALYNGQPVTTLTALRTSGWTTHEEPAIENDVINVLFVVQDPDALINNESLRKDMLEGWGYVVELIDDSDSQAAYDNAADRNDVAYIPEPVEFNVIGDKLVSTTIGVVMDERQLLNGFGFATAVAFENGALNIEITNNSHFITQDFNTGFLAVHNSAYKMYYLKSGVAAGATSLAKGESSNKPMLVVIDTGGALSGGGTAPGRRVLFPWSCDNMDFNNVSGDARTIIKRSLAWAAGKETVLDPPASSSKSSTTESSDWFNNLYR